MRPEHAPLGGTRRICKSRSVRVRNRTSTGLGPLFGFQNASTFLRAGEWCEMSLAVSYAGSGAVHAGLEYLSKILAQRIWSMTPALREKSPLQHWGVSVRAGLLHGTLRCFVPGTARFLCAHSGTAHVSSADFRKSAGFAHAHGASVRTNSTQMRQNSRGKSTHMEGRGSACRAGGGEGVQMSCLSTEHPPEALTSQVRRPLRVLNPSLQ